MHVGKLLGPNTFSGRFYQLVWPVHHAKVATHPGVGVYTEHKEYESWLTGTLTWESMSGVNAVVKSVLNVPPRGSILLDNIL